MSMDKNMDQKKLRDLIAKETKQVADDLGYFDFEADHTTIDDALSQAIPGLQVFSHQDVRQALRHTKNSKSEGELKALLSEDLWKPFANINNDALEKLDELEKQFPNFSEVTNLCKTQFTLSLLEKPASVHLPPILLSGPPGIGKTLFMQSLARMIGTTFYLKDMSSVTSGFVLSGGSSAWADSKPGFISSSMRKSRYANPVMMLDEIDKVSGSMQFDPLGAFYNLMEEDTAKYFVDEYLDIPMDASGILWVATANYLERIPDPIRSRMRVIEISPPDKNQAETIAQSIYRSILVKNRWGKHFHPALSEGVLKKVAALPPREMRQSLNEALGQAVRRSGDHDRPFNLIEKDIPKPHSDSQQTRGIGFLASL